MQKPLNRRQFVNRSTTLLAGGVLLGTTITPTDQARGIDPFPRTEPGPLKLGLAAYSFRDSLTKPAGGPQSMDLFGFIDYCRTHQVAGAEITSYYFPKDFDTAYLLRLRRHAHVSGVSICGGAIRNDFCVDADQLDAQLAMVRRWVDVYAVLGAPVIRIFAGSPPAGVSRDEAIERCTAACEKACEYAGQHGIFLALENHHGITDTPESMLRVVEGVQSEWFGVNLDSGNFDRVADPYQALTMIAPYAINAQVKIEISEGGQKVPADYRRIINILRQASYGGWVVLEYEGTEPAREAIPGHLKQLSELLEI